MTDTARCKYCGGERFLIETVFVGRDKRLAVVFCEDYKCDLLPVVIDYFCQDDEFYKKCADAWNAANVVPNSELRREP